MEIKELRNKLERLKGERTQLSRIIQETKRDIRLEKRDLKFHEQAREIVKEVGLKTQQQLQYHISDITSLALEAVFDDAYELQAEFVERRNKTECDLVFIRDGNKIDPLSSSGGGAVDVAAFALRVASWSMQFPKSRNTIILDEPFRFLSKDKQYKASQMIQELSKKLGIQFIIVTHESILAEYADKEFKILIKNGISEITENTL